MCGSRTLLRSSRYPRHRRPARSFASVRRGALSCCATRQKDTAPVRCSPLRLPELPCSTYKSMPAWTIGLSLILAALPPARAFTSGKEVAPFTCLIVLVDRQALSWIGSGQSRSFKEAYEKALQNACDELPENERTLCRQQAPMGKWGNTINRRGDPARPGRARTSFHVTVEVFKPRSRIRAVGRAMGFLTGSPTLEEHEAYARACQRALQQACRLLGAEVTPGFVGPARGVASRPCVGLDWFLAERTVGGPADPEGAAFNPDARSKAPVPNMSRPVQRGRPRSVRGGN